MPQRALASPLPLLTGCRRTARRALEEMVTYSIVGKGRPARRCWLVLADKPFLWEVWCSCFSSRHDLAGNHKQVTQWMQVVDLVK